MYNWMYEVYHYFFTSKNWTPVRKPAITSFSHYIIPFYVWLLMCHTVKKKNSFSTGAILLLWHFPSTAPATKHPLDACRSEWLHFHLPCHWGRTSSLPQQREAERTTHFSDSDMHGLIFACEQPQVKLFINCIHHLSGRVYITRLTNMSSSLPSHIPFPNSQGKSCYCRTSPVG